MKKQALISAIAVSALLAVASFVTAQEVQSLRTTPVDEANVVEDVFQQDKQRFGRNYRQQPPLIPHSIEQYQIDLKANQCLRCHDWSTAGERNAPTLSMTHYLDRDGNQLDRVAGTRWFCNQCHVPQVDAPALVDNTFEASSGSN